MLRPYLCIFPLERILSLCFEIVMFSIAMSTYAVSEEDKVQRCTTIDTVRKCRRVCDIR
jgi:hypothetical protein